MKMEHGSGRRMSLAVIGAGLVTAGLLSACGASKSPTATTALATTAPSATTPHAATTPPTATTTATKAPPASTPPASKPPASKPPASTPTNAPAKATHGYADARVQWQKGANAISAEQGRNWANAAADLTKGEATDGGDTSGYPAAIKDLKSLESLPDAQQTPAQGAEYRADIDALNKFFKTPSLYS